MGLCISGYILYKLYYITSIKQYNICVCVCLFLSFFVNFSDTAKPNELKFWGMIPLRKLNKQPRFGQPFTGKFPMQWKPLADILNFQVCCGKCRQRSLVTYIITMTFLDIVRKKKTTRIILPFKLKKIKNKNIQYIPVFWLFQQPTHFYFLHLETRVPTWFYHFWQTWRRMSHRCRLSLPWVCCRLAHLLTLGGSI